MRLTVEVRRRLQQLVQSDTRPVRVARLSPILLNSEEGFTGEEIVEHVGCVERTVHSMMRK